MRSFSKDHRLQALSVEEIVSRYEEFTSTLKRKRRKLRGRRLFPGPLLNALILSFLELPEREREEHALRSLARLELFLCENDEERARTQAEFPEWLDEPAEGPKIVREHQMVDPDDPDALPPPEVKITKGPPRRPKSRPG